MRKTNDLRISNIQPLISPEDLKKEFPMTVKSNETVVKSRKAILNILEKKDKRLLAVVGPCSIHDIRAAGEYASLLKELSGRIEDRILVVMRVYFEKPRTSIGWRGLIVDPHLDGSDDIEQGLKIARQLLLDITESGLSVGSEMLDPIVPQYNAELISWAAIGARTTESQIHREMASGLSMPVGFKNSTSGNLQIAMDALKSTIHPHRFIGIDQSGQTCVLQTTGNKGVHLIMRGGLNRPNYYEENVEEAEYLFKENGLEPRIMIDCSHANSGKMHTRQERVLNAILDQRKRGKESIVGFMLESSLKEGRQEIAQKKDRKR